MIGPFSVDAILLVINMWAMWLTAGCMVKLDFPFPRRLQALGVAVFMSSSLMAVLNLCLWLGVPDLLNQPWRYRL